MKVEIAHCPQTYKKAKQDVVHGCNGIAFVNINEPDAAVIEHG